MLPVFRHALEDSLERAFVPALAAVISFIDVKGNLQLLDSDTLTSIWMAVFEKINKLGLTFEHLTKQRDSAGSKSVCIYSIARVLASTCRFNSMSVCSIYS